MKTNHGFMAHDTIRRRFSAVSRGVMAQVALQMRLTEHYHGIPPLMALKTRECGNQPWILGVPYFHTNPNLYWNLSNNLHPYGYTGRIWKVLSYPKHFRKYLDDRE